jgi:hypothetical protein
MNDLEIRSGPNDSGAHLGPLAGLARFSYGQPALPTRHPEEEAERRDEVREAQP